MEQNQNAVSAVIPPKRGIIDRLKAATSSEDVSKIIAEFTMFANASAKTVRRFWRVAKAKGVKVSQIQDETIIEVP